MKRKNVCMYKTVFGNTMNDLDHAVNKLLGEGWYPHGSMSVVARVPGSSTSFYQPMMKWYQEVDEDDSTK